MLKVSKKSKDWVAVSPPESNHASIYPAFLEFTIRLRLPTQQNSISSKCTVVTVYGGCDLCLPLSLPHAFRSLSLPMDSQDPTNRICDAPGSWYCNGQYPPALADLIGRRKDFAQLEDFNKKRSQDDEDYNKAYMARMVSRSELLRRPPQPRSPAAGPQPQQRRLTGATWTHPTHRDAARSTFHCIGVDSCMLSAWNWPGNAGAIL